MDTTLVAVEFGHSRTKYKWCELSHDLIHNISCSNFYHRFLNHGAGILKPLSDLRAAPMGRKKELVWTYVTLKAFKAAKDTLANTTLLSHSVLTAPTNHMTDAADFGVGAVLQQFVEDKWCPIAYFSRKLKPVETRYSTSD